VAFFRHYKLCPIATIKEYESRCDSSRMDKVLSKSSAAKHNFEKNEKNSYPLTLEL